MATLIVLAAMLYLSGASWKLFAGGGAVAVIGGLLAFKFVPHVHARIAPLERNILRVALYELRHRPDVPDEVAIDEAVETAKELCSTDAPSFVNGILGAVQREGAAT